MAQSGLASAIAVNSFQRLPVPERVQGCERGIEARLNVGAARDGKAHVPSAALHQIMGVALGGGAARRAERKHRGKSCNKPRSCLGPAPNPGAIDHHGSTPMRFRLFIIGQFERSAITRRLLRRPIIVATWRPRHGVLVLAEDVRPPARTN